jgi:hypothetical protein
VPRGSGRGRVLRAEEYRQLVEDATALTGHDLPGARDDKSTRVALDCATCSTRDRAVGRSPL